jgi:CubicO group peptidase (beta-lactamase class C family)
MGKTIGGLIAAQAIDANKFSLGDPVSKWIPEYKGEAKVIDVFHMSTALAFREEYAGLPVNSDASKMLYIDGVRDGFAKYTATRAARPGVKPGDHFYYSSGDANLIMEFLKKSIGDQKTYDDYPWNAFFNRIDIPGATFEQDSHGTFVGSSYFYMTPSEYAKIGQLLANKGKWGGVQIIPAWYFAQMNQVAPGVVLNALPGTSPSRAYSMQVTTNLPIGGRGMTNSEYPDLPADSLLMIGHQGQLVIASPSENLVIVRMATDKGDPFNPFRRAFFTAIKGYLEEDFGIKLAVAGGSGPPALPAEAAGKAKFGDYFKVPKLISEFYAKEFCSCYFVVGRNEEQCRNDLKTDLPIFSIFSRINEKKKQITASFTGLKPAKAVYKGERLGCTLVR